MKIIVKLHLEKQVCLIFSTGSILFLFSENFWLEVRSTYMNTVSVEL